MDDRHTTKPIVCDWCGYEWQAVFPTGTQMLECPECGEMTYANHDEALIQ